MSGYVCWREWFSRELECGKNRANQALLGYADIHRAGKQAGFALMLTSQFQFENGPSGPQVVAGHAGAGSAALQEEPVEENGIGSPIRQTCTGLRVLFVEDDPSDIDLLALALRKGGFEASHDVAETAEAFVVQIQRNPYDVILADYNLPSWNGMATVEILRREGLDIPVVLVSGALGETRAVECIKQGAADYVLKDQLLRLPEAVRRAVREKKLREEHRRSLEELARSNRDLEQFAYVASHDLQEPLRMVAAYTQLLAERYQGKLDENADKYIHYAVDGALRMQRLVQDLLAFSRIGRSGAERRKVDCNSVLATALQNLQAAIGESGARVEAGQLPWLLADASQLLQLFQNLVANAIKFRGAEPPLICINAEKSGREWKFSFADNGIGIASEHAELVFVIFKRLHTRSEYPGNGIGLSICKKIVEQQGGRIWVEPVPGRGCTFCFTLPAKDPETGHD
jgi:signal transduction histidine kinase